MEAVNDSIGTYLSNVSLIGVSFRIERALQDMFGSQLFLHGQQKRVSLVQRLLERSIAGYLSGGFCTDYKSIFGGYRC